MWEIVWFLLRLDQRLVSLFARDHPVINRWGFCTNQRHGNSSHRCGKGATWQPKVLLLFFDRLARNNIGRSLFKDFLPVLGRQLLFDQLFQLCFLSIVSGRKSSSAHSHVRQLLISNPDKITRSVRVFLRVSRQLFTKLEHSLGFFCAPRALEGHAF